MKLAALAILCASPIWAEEFAPFDVAQVKTFHIGEVTAKSKTTAIQAERLIPVLRERIAARLRELGLSESGGPADVRITASLNVDSDRRTAARRRPLHQYDYRGRLFISIRAGKANALVWQKFPSFSEDESKWFEERLHRHVDRAMSGFPPKN
ncbi:MAG: DUF4136 domain-containing protein [Bryobacteraceae bacterium]